MSIKLLDFLLYMCFWIFDTFRMETLTKKIKSEKIYIGTSLCMSQDQQNHSLIIHDMFEDLFTIVI